MTRRARSPAKFVAACIAVAAGLLASCLNLSAQPDAGALEHELEILPPGAKAGQMRDLADALRELRIPSISVALIGKVAACARTSGRGQPARGHSEYESHVELGRALDDNQAMTFAARTKIARRNRVALAAGAAAMAALCLSATLLNAALPGPAETPERNSLAGQILIAAPAMRDPRFYHAVILMVRHDQSGAFGIVINRPLGERSLASVLKAVGEKDASATGRATIFLGGPVQPEIGFVVHSTDYRRDDTVVIDGQMAMTSSHEILHDIAKQQGPKKSIIAFGYAGWGAGQLEGELKQRAWYTGPADEKLIFDEPRDKVWDEAMKHRTQDL